MDEWKNTGESEAKINFYSFTFNATDEEKELALKAQLCFIQWWNLPSPWFLKFERNLFSFHSVDYSFTCSTHAYLSKLMGVMENEIDILLGLQSFDDRYIYFKSALWWALEKMTKNTHAWPCTGICRNSQSILDNPKKARPTESSNKRDLHLLRRMG